jgi:enterochelin esterase family protein
MKSALAAASLLIAVIPLTAQEVHPDRTVTFHYSAPNAHEVSVSGDWGKGGPLTKDEAGLWSLTVGPLEPNLYSYNLTVDG